MKLFSRRWIVILFSLFLVVIGISYFAEIFGPKLSPNLLFALCLALVLVKKYDLAYIVAIVAGILFDILSGGLIGRTSFLLTVFVLIYSQLRSFYLRSIIWQFLFSTICLYLLTLLSIRVLIFDPQLILGCIFSVIIAYLMKSIINQNEKINF